MNTLPEEVLRQIWRKTYDYVINEIDEFLKKKQVYVYKKPNVLNEHHVDFTIRHTWDMNMKNNQYEKYVFVSTEKFCWSGRIAHTLYFYEAFLHLKHHPIGYFEYDGTLKKIKHYYYESDSDYEEYRYPSKSDSEDE